MSLFGLSLSPLSLRLTDKLCKANKSINVLYTCSKFTSTSRSFLLSATTLSERLNKSFLGGKVKWDTYKKIINKYWFQTDESKENMSSNSHFSDEIYFIEVNEMTAKPLTSGNFFFISWWSCRNLLYRLYMLQTSSPIAICTVHKDQCA